MSSRHMWIKKHFLTEWNETHLIVKILKSQYGIFNDGRRK